jgi:hypothetical protein
MIRGDQDLVDHDLSIPLVMVHGAFLRLNLRSVVGISGLKQTPNTWGISGKGRNITHSKTFPRLSKYIFILCRPTHPTPSQPTEMTNFWAASQQAQA